MKINGIDCRSGLGGPFCRDTRIGKEASVDSKGGDVDNSEEIIHGRIFAEIWDRFKFRAMTKSLLVRERQGVGFCSFLATGEKSTFPENAIFNKFEFPFLTQLHD